MTPFPTQLECPTAEVVPGEPLRCRLKIYNPSDAVNEFTVVGVDDAAGWVSTDPASLALLPETDGEMLVNVVIPTDAPVEAGQHTLHIRIRSALDEFEDKIEDLVLVVTASTGWELDVAPQTEEGRTAVRFTVRVRNTGNHPVEAHLSTSPSSPNLTATLTDAVVTVPAFQTSSSTLEVAAPAHTSRDDVHHHVDVHAHVEGTPAQSRRVTYVQRPGHGRRRVVLATVVVVLLAAAIVGGRIWWDGQVQRDDRVFEVAVFFVDATNVQHGQQPFVRAVPRTIPVPDVDPAVARNTLEHLFAGPTPDEQQAGLVLVTSRATGVARVELVDDVLFVRLAGRCDRDLPVTIADQLIPTMKQFRTVQFVKIFDPDGTTLHHDRRRDSIPACLAQ